jgi:hypothetical protein
MAAKDEDNAGLLADMDNEDADAALPSRFMFGGDKFILGE